MSILTVPDTRPDAVPAAARRHLRALEAKEDAAHPAGRNRRRTGPTPPLRPVPGLRTSTSSPAGALVPRPVLEGTERAEEWDRLHFRPSLGTGGTASRQASTAGDDMPDPARFAAVVVTAAAEVLHGQRRADHLARWTTPELFEALSRRAGLARRLLGQAPTRVRPRSAHAQKSDNGTCEVTILLDDGARVRAAAARLEAFRGRWLLAALEIA
ncbi:Rv3235 family protein [Actinomyces sp. 432]|uniref:Rv3235 family protein n=1 Tax=Actinomyces sp. 432 TaxID=2057798 RepID=UPI001F3A999C|nr:Rv3235 family protein [Actinomyces sp. 432]